MEWRCSYCTALHQWRPSYQWVIRYCSSQVSAINIITDQQHIPVMYQGRHRTGVKLTCSWSWVAQSAFCRSISRSRSLRNSSCLASSNSFTRYAMTHSWTTTTLIKCIKCKRCHLPELIRYHGTYGMDRRLRFYSIVAISCYIFQITRCTEILMNNIEIHTIDHHMFYF